MIKLGNNVTCLNRSGHHVSENEFDAHNECIIQNQFLRLIKKELEI